jgi:hypothetical protein
MVVPVGTMMMMPAVMAVVMMPPVTMAVMVVPAIVMVAMPPMVVMMVVVTPPAPMHLLDRARSLRNAGVYGAGHRCNQVRDMLVLLLARSATSVGAASFPHRLRHLPSRARAIPACSH